MEPTRQGCYSERFGELVPRTVLQFHREVQFVITLGYILSKRASVKIERTRGSRCESHVLFPYDDKAYLLILRRDQEIFSEFHDEHRLLFPLFYARDQRALYSHL